MLSEDLIKQLRLTIELLENEINYIKYGRTELLKERQKEILKRKLKDEEIGNMG